MRRETGNRVALAVIGDEVLAGEVRDENMPFLAARLGELGSPLGFAEVLPDDLGFLTERLRWMKGRFSWVLATGGIGPTHDDVTREAAAACFGVPLTENPGALGAMEAAWGKPLRERSRRMALLPEGCELIPNPSGAAPGFILGNLAVFPGIPRMVREMFPFLEPRLAGTPLAKADLFTLLPESEIAGVLEEALARFPGVRIGSYPALQRDAGWRVKVVLRGPDPGRVEEARGYLAGRFAR